MSSRTLTQYEGTLQLALGNRGFQATQLDYWINTAVEDLTGRVPFEVLSRGLEANIAANGNVLTFTEPTDLEDLDGVMELSNLTDGVLMLKVGSARWNLFDESETGQPKFWYRRGDEILVWPKVKVATDFRGVYLLGHPLLTAPADTTLLDNRWNRAIDLLAQFHAQEDLEEPLKAQNKLAVAEKYIRERMTLDDIEGRATQMGLQPVETRRQLFKQREFDVPVI